MKFPKLPKVFKKKNSSQDEVEKEFANGNIILPTETRDYENYEDFKEKTSHLENIQKKLGEIESGE